MEVVLDMGAGHVDVRCGVIERGAFFVGHEPRSTPAAVIAETMRAAGDPDAGWRLTVVAPEGARPHTMELAAALLRAFPAPPEQVLVTRTGILADQGGWYTLAAEADS